GPSGDRGGTPELQIIGVGDHGQGTIPVLGQVSGGAVFCHLLCHGLTLRKTAPPRHAFLVKNRRPPDRIGLLRGNHWGNALRCHSGRPFEQRAAGPPEPSAPESAWAR